jgi:hypothetical protein
MSQQDFLVIIILIILAVMWLLSQQLPLRSYEPTGSAAKDKAVDEGKC